MATTINRQRVLGHLLDSPMGEVNEPLGLPVLEQFIFALCREGSTDEQARQAYEDVEAARASLEHLVPKAKGPTFTDAISNLAEKVCWEEEPNCAVCPLSADCLYAQENLGDQLATARTARAKPR